MCSSRTPRLTAPPARLAIVLLMLLAPGCAENRAARRPASRAAQAATTQPLASQPAVIYDTTVPKPVAPRDFFERWAMNRGPDLRLVDRLMDKRTPLPPFDRQPPASMPADAQIAPGVPLLAEDDPFPEPLPLPPKAVSTDVAIARSTYRTRTPEEALSAAQPFIDIVHRDVNMRGQATLYETPQDLYFGLLDGKVQMGIAHIFDALLIRSWFANSPDNRVILLSWAQPANPYVTAMDAEAPGPPGTGIALVVPAGAPYKTFADLKGARLALPANYVDAPGAFLTRQLRDLNHPLDTPFFGSVTLRRFSKDALLDLLNYKADVACVDEDSLGAVLRFYGLEKQLRVLAVSPHYNIDVLFTSSNNVATHRTQIELTQRILLTLAKDPEGQEVLFFFDIASWNSYREGDLAPAIEHFDDFVQFFQHPPADLKVLLDPHAPVNRQTYTRYGDE